MILSLLVACGGDEAGVREVLVVSDTGSGRLVLLDRADGSELGEICVDALLPLSCGEETEGCVVFGADPFRDGGDSAEILYSQRGGADFPGGLVRASLGAAEVEWNVDRLQFPYDPVLEARCSTGAVADPSCGLDMPHVAEWMPDETHLVVADTLNDRVVWLEPDPLGSRAVVDRILDDSHADAALRRWPNSLQVLGWEDGRTFLLTTWKGSEPSSGGGDALGSIALWDLTAIDTRISLVWEFPDPGWLAAVHRASIVETPSGWMLVYAHSRGASDDAEQGEAGSIGLARIDAIDERPTYLGDGVIAGGLGFLREAEVIDGGRSLLLTDSGCENLEYGCSREAVVAVADFDIPDEPGLSGAWSPAHEQQRFTDLDATRLEDGAGLSFPFETDLVSIDPSAAIAQTLDGCGGVR